MAQAVSPEVGLEVTAGPGAPQTRVELVPMSQQNNVRKPEDDWTGITSAAERRKLQNRLSQRRYRQARARTKKETQTPPTPPECSASTTSAQRNLAVKFRGLANAVNHHDNTHNSLLDKMGPSVLRKMADEFEIMMQRDFLLGSPRVDLVLTLIQFNVFRALLSNTQSLGWDFQWLECEEPDSPWTAAVNNEDATSTYSSCPLSLQPTDMQRKVRHHPWIDLWPIPKMRDNLLLAAGLYDEDELCNVLLEFKDIPNEQSGLLVWGEPWDSASWEVSATFVRHWAWAIQGCDELQASTNRWRIARGEKPLRW
ncbi:hypothetical protein PFICI_07485 [Pestalotiopsis fici W106-1]|uniref:BZIP domain-containing protein n=1 Tax=Pestalotiopsis fici (strain W106-1 / CGMCC3.15140) TaxID=1229662 RepID=W3X453_PESFW|nr:uncharacterized protein PFICI_07485 [Pestalotiopsis fici W106-1]ETS79956.1 hypothetical protein PFICI_07485 [Pestalotiopsis fici W106-1]